MENHLRIQDRGSPFPGPWKPWERVTCKTERTDTKKSDPPDVYRRQALVKILNSEPTEVTAYTDGSAVESNRKRGAGVFIVAGDDRLEVARPAGVFTSSFQADLVALNRALKTCLDNYPRKSLKVITDSLSVVNRMEQLCDSNSPRATWKNKQCHLSRNITIEA